MRVSLCLRHFLITTLYVTILCASTSAIAEGSRQYNIAKGMLLAVCGEFLSSGRFQSLIIEGNAEAKLAGLIEKLPDPGVTGAASFQTDKYVDVLPRICSAASTDRFSLVQSAHDHKGGCGSWESSP